MARFFSKRTLAVLLTLVMMVNFFSVSAKAAVTAATETVQNFPDTYYKQDGTAGTDSDWEIHLSKTAAPTAQDNIFDITLKIETKDTTSQTAGSADGAAEPLLLRFRGSPLPIRRGKVRRCTRSRYRAKWPATRRRSNRDLRPGGNRT